MTGAAGHTVADLARFNVVHRLSLSLASAGMTTAMLVAAPYTQITGDVQKVTGCRKLQVFQIFLRSIKT